MSGRLIILPKKSWHPGKRENIEKVLRDERLAAEETAAARHRAREIVQEGVVETLARKRSVFCTPGYYRRMPGHITGNVWRYVAFDHGCCQPGTIHDVRYTIESFAAVGRRAIAKTCTLRTTWMGNKAGTIRRFCQHDAVKHRERGGMLGGT